MTSYIALIKQSSKQTIVLCSYPGCTDRATCAHHTVYRSEGGTDSLDNLQPLCFYHHHRTHATRQDWSRWGKKTASNPYNWLRNLRQFRSWSDERLAAYVANKYGALALDARRDLYDDTTWNDHHSKFEL